MHLFTDSTRPINALVVTPDGARLFSTAAGQATIRAWDVASRRVERKLRGEVDDGVAVLACSPEGDFLVSGEPGRPLVVWSLPDAQPRRLDFPSHDTVGFQPTAAVHPSGRWLVGPCCPLRREPQGFQTWDLHKETLRRRGLGHTERTHAVACSPDGKLVATAAPDRTVRLWHFDTGAPRHVLTMEVVPNRIAFRPDGRALAVAGGRSVFVWDVESGRLLETLAGHAGNVAALAYSPDGRYLASAGLDGVAVLRDAQTHQPAGQLHPDVGRLTALAWRPDSGALFLGGEGPIALCELAEALGPGRRGRGEPLSLAGHTKRVEGLAYSPDGHALASHGSQQVRIWDLAGGPGRARERACVPLDGSGPRSVAFSPDGKLLATAFAHGAFLHDAHTGAVPNAKCGYGKLDFFALLTKIGVGRTHWVESPLPPNRTCGSPASGSPVRGLTG